MLLDDGDKFCVRMENDVVDGVGDYLCGCGCEVVDRVDKVDRVDLTEVKVLQDRVCLEKSLAVYSV